MIGLRSGGPSPHGLATLDVLSPAQEGVYAELKIAADREPLVLLEGGVGTGKTTLIKRLLAERGGRRLTTRDLFALSANASHAALDGALLQLFETALDRADLVAFDDFDRIGALLQARLGQPRSNYWGAGLQTLLERARMSGKTLVFSGAELAGIPLLAARGWFVKIEPLLAEDYAVHLEAILGAQGVGQLDVRDIFEHASKLNPYQIQFLARCIQKEGRWDRAFVHETLDQRIANTNVHLDEIANISFSDLKGFEHIAEQLATYVINPLMGDPRFTDLGLRPKRGVLLFGPPGTGKTSVGRALARKMRGQFFLIDGSVVTDPSDAFYNQIRWIFAAAKRAAPSVVFIDDADVLFQSDRGTGLSRYLLTMLDGLESETAGKVAVVLTAMDPNHLPAALLRSGRVELWLETKPPAEPVRAEMIAAHLKAAPAAFADYDPCHAARLSEGFTAADMRRLVMDVKALYGRDLLADRDPAPISSYFENAIADIRAARALLAAAVGDRLSQN